MQQPFLCSAPEPAPTRVAGLEKLSGEKHVNLIVNLIAPLHRSLICLVALRCHFKAMPFVLAHSLASSPLADVASL